MNGNLKKLSDAIFKYWNYIKSHYPATLPLTADDDFWNEVILDSSALVDVEDEDIKKLMVKWSVDYMEYLERINAKCQTESE